MTLEELLATQAKAHATARSARYFARMAICGAIAVILILFLARLGLELPGLWMPDLPRQMGFAAHFLGYFAISLAGVVQGAVLLAAVLAAAFLASRGAALLRWGPGRTAHALDRICRTDRFRAALEAVGPMRVAARGHAIQHAPPKDALAGSRPGRLQRWLFYGLVLTALLVAISPGTAPGGEGQAPVAGEPAKGASKQPLVLRLFGPARPFTTREPVIVQVIAEAAEAPQRDLSLAVTMVIDGGEAQKTGRELFLPAGEPDAVAVAFNLRRFLKGLKPGEHVAVARAGGVESNEYRFKIEEQGQGGSAPKPKPQPKKQPKPKGGGGNKGTDPQVDPKFVKPLVNKGDKVKKKARVPIEVAGGAPTDKPLKEAWPELKKRREAALKRPGLSPHARKLVKEYFDKLRPDE